MAQIIKVRSIVNDDWQLLRVEDVQTSGVPATGKVIVPLATWQEQKEALLARGDVAVWLEAGEEPELIATDLDKLPLVAINFPVFRDGRGYSYARELRQRYGYKGEVRAIGDVLQDQLFYMWRCGFDAFAVREDRDIHEALNGLNGFSVTYQGDVHIPEPIYHRRPAWHA
jgi:uncharacterized protein (DUF934 family)